jgi:putative flavoprotein involved in K+ transport
MGDRQVVVVGGGPAGLACAVELERRGIPAVVLERGEGAGAAWRGRYDRLRLNSSRPFSRLPRAAYPRGTGLFPSAAEMVRYLESYAGRHQLDVRSHTSVERIDRNGAGWVVRTPKRDIAAPQVVVATGHDGQPFMPAWPGRDRFEGALLHAADYRNPEPFRDRDVLVAGAGCSGMEIAYDLAVCGARRVRIAVRTPPNILVRTPAGPLFALILLRLPPRRADAVVNFLRRHEVGDLSEFGLPVPEEGVFSRLKRLGVAPAIVDKAWLQAIRDGRIEIVGGVESLDGTGVRLADGTRIEPDAVIAATGYRRGLEPLVGHLGVLAEDGAPRAVAAAPAAPGLRFVGYVPIPGQIAHMGREARRAARAIAHELRGAAAATAVAATSEPPGAEARA